MAHQVLARKWRPSNFTQLVGQEHVSRSLMHALQHQRLHHAYLFTGTRGVGKTTVARILAKAINCLNLKDFNPCGECAVCRDFEQGRFMDLIEVDAASRTKVEDTRDLLDNAQYAPNQGRYKVYLIDEVHMLSGHSFNALLKTLEEPPEHIKFLLATTDPQKIPVTVLSRCLQLNLKRLTPAQIDRQMQFILGEEQIDFDHNAVRQLAWAADGSLRDGLSLLDQAIVYGDGKVELDSVLQMLGTVGHHTLDELARLLLSGDAAKLLARVAELAELNPNYADLLQQLLKILHRTALQQHLPDWQDSEFDPQLIRELAQAWSPEDVQLYYQIGLLGQRDLPLAPDARTGFEMTLLRMLSFRPTVTSSAIPLPSLAISAKPQSIAPSKPAMAVSTAPVAAPVTAAVPPATGHSSDNEDWSTIVSRLPITGRSRELANNCVLNRIEDHTCRLLIDPGFHRVGNKAEDNLREALQQYFGKPLKLIIEAQTSQQTTPAQAIQQQRETQAQNAVDAINNDERVLALKNQFQARVIPGSIEPNS
jgi:DNA polymerase III subunit gamma/tau